MQGIIPCRQNAERHPYFSDFRGGFLPLCPIAIFIQPLFLPHIPFPSTFSPSNQFHSSGPSYHVPVYYMFPTGRICAYAIITQFSFGLDFTLQRHTALIGSKLAWYLHAGQVLSGLFPCLSCVHDG